MRDPINRLLPLFTWRKLLGWLTTIFGLVGQAIHWGWISLDYFGRVDVGWRIVETMGGSAALFAAIFSSWQFSLALVVVGVAYLIIVGEPEAGVQRHPALPYLAASVLVICLAAMGSIAIYGWFELQQREAYAKGATGIPRDSSPSNPQTPSNQRPLYSDGPRILTPDQKRILITEGAKIREELGVFFVTFLSTDGESRSYANEINATLQRAAINCSVNTQQLGDPTNEGIVIQVGDNNNPPNQAIKLRELLTLADIPSRYVNDLAFDPKNFPVVLFVAPRPIQR